MSNKLRANYYLSFHVDMQCCCCGQNHECHSYSACVKARPDLERPNVSYLYQKVLCYPCLERI